MKVIIVEDEKLSADRLNKLVSEIASIEVINTCYSVKSACDWLAKNETPDLIFLDIQLGDGTGFDVLDSLEAFPKVIFTTAFDKYVLEAFKYNSLDYLLKPVKSEDLKQAIDKLNKVKNTEGNFDEVVNALKTQIQKSYKKKFLVKIGLKYQSIPVKEIAYFYSETSSTFLRTKSGNSMIVDHSLDEVQSLVDPEDFFRINRHMLVYLESITSIDSYFNNRLMLSLAPDFDDSVVVSREKVRPFKEWLDK